MPLIHPQVHTGTAKASPGTGGLGVRRCQESNGFLARCPLSSPRLDPQSSVAGAAESDGLRGRAEGVVADDDRPVRGANHCRLERYTKCAAGTSRDYVSRASSTAQIKGHRESFAGNEQIVAASVGELKGLDRTGRPHLL